MACLAVTVGGQKARHKARQGRHVKLRMQCGGNADEEGTNERHDQSERDNWKAVETKRATEQ